MNMDLLDILVCPRTKGKLVMASDSVIQKIYKVIKAGKCRDISGNQITETVTEGLYQPDNKVFYLIRDGIPLLIYDNGILLD